MKSNVVMDSVDRELCGLNVRQRTKDEYLCLADVVAIVNKSRAAQLEPGAVLRGLDFKMFVKQRNISRFVESLERKVGGRVYSVTTAQSPGWVHPFLALKILTHFNPDFEIAVYEWFYDYLIRNRLAAGDAYTLMNGVLYEFYPNKHNYASFIVKVNSCVNKRIGITSRQTAAQEQLDKLVKLQESIANVASALGDAEEGVKRALEVFDKREAKAKLNSN